MDCGGLFLLHVCCTERNLARSSGSLEPDAPDDFIASVWAKSASDTAKGRLQRDAWSLLREHERAGEIPTSNRFLFYELVQRGVIRKSRTGAGRPDQNLTDAVMHLRERGLIPWDWIVDETRHVSEWRYAATVRAYARAAIRDARIDCWDREPPPLILTESRSLAGVLEAVAGEYLCPIAATNGQAGGFLVTEIAPLLEDGRRVLYLGDWDWQGLQIEDATRRRLEEQVGPIEDWGRLALTEEQVVEHDLELLVVTKPDRRYKHDLEKLDDLGRRSRPRQRNHSIVGTKVRHFRGCEGVGEAMTSLLPEAGE